MQDQPRKDPLAAAEATQLRDKSAPSSTSGKPPSGRRNAMVSTTPCSLCSALPAGRHHRLPGDITNDTLVHLGKLLPPALSGSLAERQVELPKH